MLEIDRITEELSNAILKSREYKNYLYYKELLDKDPQLRDLVNDVRRKSFLANNTAGMNSRDVYNEVQRFKDEYDLVKSNDLAVKFLNAELTMCRILQDINYRIIRELDFEIDFMK